MVSIKAQTVSIEDASVVAINYYKAYGSIVGDSGIYMSPSSAQVKSIVNWSKADSTYLYFVNIQGGGWVLVPNEERYVPVLGFSKTDSVSLSDTLTMPLALRVLLDDYMNVIDSIRQHNDIQSIELQTKWRQLKTRNISTDSVQTSYQRSISNSSNNYYGQDLLNNNRWNQQGNSSSIDDCDKVYNKFCPTFWNPSCGRTYVGCTAVAMAQVMWYWQWPDYGNIAPSIGPMGTTYGTSVPHYYDWRNMPTDISNQTDMYQVDMVAGLLRDCGYAAHMIYSFDGSAATLAFAKAALRDIFKYSDANLISKIGKSDEEWGNLMRSEINLGRPVIFQATAFKDAEGNADLGMHTFVVDGYQLNNPNMFHINFGWGGYKTGEYNLTDFCYYNYGRFILTGLFPDCSQRITSSNLPYNQIYDGEFKRQYAINNINVSTLQINDGGNLLLDAGNQIVITSGFQARAGSNFEARIKNDFLCDGVIFESNPNSSSFMRSVSHPLSQNQKITIYPNPTSNDIFVEVQEQLLNLELYTINGQKILQTQENTLQMSSLPQGIYLLKVYTANGVAQEKIIKQ